MQFLGIWDAEAKHDRLRVGSSAWREVRDVGVGRAEVVLGLADCRCGIRLDDVGSEFSGRWNGDPDFDNTGPNRGMTLNRRRHAIIRPVLRRPSCHQ